MEQAQTVVADKQVSAQTIELLATAGAGSPARGLVPSTTKKFGVVVQGKGEDERHIYPLYGAEDPSKLVAVKRRLPGKEFPSEGTLKNSALFGQQLFTGGGRNIVITEGEVDCMSVWQLQGSKYPSVSVRNASTALSDCKRNYEFLDSYDTVMVCFDNDEAGRKASLEVAALFSGKSKQIVFPSEYKDANDVLLDGAKGANAWKQAFWNAADYTPPGILSGADMWDAVSAPVVAAEASYPWEGINAKTYGIHLGQLITVASGSGMGKTQFLREIVGHLLDTTDYKMGLMFLEESATHTAKGLMSYAADKPLHLPGTEATEFEMKQAFDATLGTGRLSFLDHFGGEGIEEIIARMRYFVKAQDCKVLFLDHISILVSGGDQDDERKALDQIMTKLAVFAQENGVAVFIVSHLKRPNGEAHEDGGTTSLGQLRGSAAIAQLSDIVIGLERNGQDDDPTVANTTRVRILKNRFSGEVGLADSLLFSKKTGRMSKIVEISTQTHKQLEGAL
jgi:twinkle protein